MRRLRLAALALALFAFWLLLSGHYTQWLTLSGALASVAIASLGIRAGFGDREGFPVERLAAGLFYWPWLIAEMVKSALSVTRTILRPSLPISPRLVELDAATKSTIGLATYANSITLTPGTLTVEIDQGRRKLRVHALTGAGEADLRTGAMERRVRRFEGAG